MIFAGMIYLQSFTMAQNVPGGPTENETDLEINSTNDDFGNDTGKQQDTGEKFSMSASLKPQVENNGLLLDGTFDIKNFTFVVSNSSVLCPKKDCNFTFVHDKYEGFKIGGVTDRELSGTLNVTKDGKSKFYVISGNFNVIEQEAKEGNQTKETLDGHVGIYIGSQPTFSSQYHTNGTLTWKEDKRGDLALQVEHLFVQ